MVQASFTQWDGNGDGVLSKEEIYAAASNPDVKGPSAAAVATLVHYVRNQDFTLPPLTQKYLVAAAAHGSRQKADPGEDAKNPDNLVKKTPAFESTFHNYLRKIDQTSRRLFAQGLPVFDAVHQGGLGDCPFVSTVGALVYRNPVAVKNMFEERENGTVVVHFGNGLKIKLATPTDADIAIWSTAGTNGLWFTALEKAYRTILVAAEHPIPEDRPSIYDKFGPSSRTIEIMDGYKTEKIPLRKLKSGLLKLGPLRTKLESAINEKLIVKTGTSKSIQIPGITPDHAYAILGFSPEKGLVQVWNPHGQEFEPGGAEGLANGYETKRGMFHVPLKEFVQIFDEVIIETKIRTQN